MGAFAAASRLTRPLWGDAAIRRERGEKVAWALGEVEEDPRMLDPEFVGQEFRDLFDQKLTWGETLGVDRHSTWDVLRRLAPTTNRGEEPTSETGIFEGVARCVERMLAVK